MRLDRNNRPVDSGPSDINRRDVISMASMSTLNTGEYLPVPIRFGNMSTSRACLRSVRRVDEYDGNTPDSGLIFDEFSELIERPFRMATTLGPSYRCPVTDTLEVLKSNSLTGVKGLGYQLLRNDVANVTFEPGFVTGEFTEMSLGTLGTTRLEPCPEGHHLKSLIINSFPSIAFSIGVHGKVDNTEIHTDNFLGPIFCDRTLFNINDNTQIKYVIDKYEIRLTTDSVSSTLEIVVHHDRDFDPAVYGQNGNPIQTFPGQDALVIYNCAMRPKSGFDVLIAFVDLSHLTNGTDRQLGRKTELLSNLMVYETLELDFISHSMFKSNLGNKITGFIKTLHGLQKTGVLPLIRGQSHLEGKVHKRIIWISLIYRYRQLLLPMDWRGNLT